MMYMWRPRHPSSSSSEQIIACMHHNHEKWWNLVRTAVASADTFRFSYFPGDPDEDDMNDSLFSTKYGLRVIAMFAIEEMKSRNTVTLSGKATAGLVEMLASLPGYYYFPISPMFCLAFFNASGVIFSSGDFGSDVFIDLTESDMGRLSTLGFASDEFRPLREGDAEA